MIENCPICGNMISKEEQFEHGYRYRYRCDKCGAPGDWLNLHGALAEPHAPCASESKWKPLNPFDWSSSKYDFLS